MRLCNRNECTACGACISACPKQCIEFVKNEYGFILPEIDESICVNCGKCEKVCPAMNSISKNYPQKAYAVWSNDPEDRKTSTSGGAASVFYNKVIENAGIGYGATFDDKLSVVIKGFDDKNIVKFKNSKYIHSNMNDTYKKIKNDLSEDKLVIFIGLPCQVAAIRSFLNKNYDNLILVDIICHGTPPQQYLDEHIEYINKNYKETTSQIKFRQDNEFMFMAFKNSEMKPFYKMTKNADSYLLSFFEALTYKEACYNCKYAENNRVSDITIGDFWGLGLEEPFDHPYTGAISVVLTNTEKGKKIFDLCRDKLFVEERLVEEAIKGNDQLNRPSTRNVNRDRFLELYKQKGFDDAVIELYGDYMKKEEKIYKKQEIKESITKFAKKILRK